MKKILAITTLLVSVNSFAYSFSMNLNCEVQYGVSGSCEVVNQLPTPIACQLSAQGQTQSGAWMNLYGQGYIYPGQVSWVNVSANNPYIDPLLFVQAQANCQTVY